MLRDLRKTGLNLITGILCCEGLFVFAVVLYQGIIHNNALYWLEAQLQNIYTYALLPWGVGLSLVRLERVRSHGGAGGGDVTLLFLLFLWIVIPMLWRFGATFNNMATNAGYAAVFFGVYASVSERSEEEKQQQLEGVSLLFSLTGVIWGGLLLYCAATGRTISSGVGTPIGVVKGYLYGGEHYNIAGMSAICCLYFSILCVLSGRSAVLRLLGFVSSVILVLVVILTQSRTSRYVMILTCAAAVWVRLAGGRKEPARQVIGILCAAAVLVAGYALCQGINRLALSHYQNLEAGRPAGIVASADAQSAEDEQPAAPAPAEAVPGKNVPRQAVDSTFSDRTNLWKNLFDLWKKEPSKMLIGRGIGNTGSLIVEGTVHEQDGSSAVHNTYLQFMADFGLVGFLLQAAFLLLVLWPLLPEFVRGRMTGSRVTLFLLIGAILLTGFMESQPLGQMTPMNVVLFYAMAILHRPRQTGGERRPI